METLTLDKQKTHKINNLKGSHLLRIPVLNLLRYTFVIVPVVAGIDKFTDLLVNWDKYLNPQFVSMLPFPAHTFMMVVGVVEIIAGIIVLTKPEIGGLIVAGWLALISLTLLAGGNYLDVAVRDLVMAVSAFTMARIFNTQIKEI
jgi:uncharacterized membrane protein YphA (DoxX/SURF4 family)